MLLTDEARLTRDALRYGYAVGKVRVLETRGLDAAAIERLLDAADFAEQRRLLSESPYGRYLENARTAEDVERGLAKALDDFYDFLSAAALPEAVTRFFLLRHDFANLKAAAKARLLSVPVADLLTAHGSVPLEAFEGDLAELPEPLRSAAAALSGLDAGAAASAEEAGEETAAEAEAPEVPSTMVAQESLALRVDTAVDKAMFSELVRAAREARSGYLMELARLSIDVANARTLVRARASGLAPAEIVELLIDGGSRKVDELAPLAELGSEELAAALARIPSLKGLSAEQLRRPETIDVALDAVTAAAWRRGRIGGQVGPEPVISYVLEREAEVATLRVLLLGRLAGIDNDRLRARVRAGA